IKQIRQDRTTRERIVKKGCGVESNALRIERDTIFVVVQNPPERPALAPLLQSRSRSFCIRLPQEGTQLRERSLFGRQSQDRGNTHLQTTLIFRQHVLARLHNKRLYKILDEPNVAWACIERLQRCQPTRLSRRQHQIRATRRPHKKLSATILVKKDRRCTLTLRH